MKGEKTEWVISLSPAKESQRLGIAELSEDGKKVLWCVERPKEPRSNLTVIGAYAFNLRFLEVYPKLVPSWRNEMEVTDAMSLLISEESVMIPHDVQVWRKDTGRPRFSCWRTTRSWTKSGLELWKG